MQGETDWNIIAEFEKIPGSRVVHLNYNKHELTFMYHSNGWFLYGRIVQSTTGSLRYKIAAQFFRSATLRVSEPPKAADSPLRTSSGVFAQTARRDCYNVFILCR